MRGPAMITKIKGSDTACLAQFSGDGLPIVQRAEKTVEDDHILSAVSKLFIY